MMMWMEVRWFPFFFCSCECQFCGGGIFPSSREVRVADAASVCGRTRSWPATPGGPAHLQSGASFVSDVC